MLSDYGCLFEWLLCLYDHASPQSIRPYTYVAPYHYALKLSILLSGSPPFTGEELVGQIEMARFNFEYEIWRGISNKASALRLASCDLWEGRDHIWGGKYIVCAEAAANV